jgi:hypothetical protein
MTHRVTPQGYPEGLHDFAIAHQEKLSFAFEHDDAIGLNGLLGPDLGSHGRKKERHQHGHHKGAAANRWRRKRTPPMAVDRASHF